MTPLPLDDPPPDPLLGTPHSPPKPPKPPPGTLQVSPTPPLSPWDGDSGTPPRFGDSGGVTPHPGMSQRCHPLSPLPPPPGRCHPLTCVTHVSPRPPAAREARGGGGGSQGGRGWPHVLGDTCDTPGPSVTHLSPGGGGQGTGGGTLRGCHTRVQREGWRWQQHPWVARGCHTCVPSPRARHVSLPQVSPKWERGLCRSPHPPRCHQTFQGGLVTIVGVPVAHGGTPGRVALVPCPHR